MPKLAVPRFILRVFGRWYFEVLVVVAIAIIVSGFLVFIQPSLRAVRVQGQSSLETSQRYVGQLQDYLDEITRVKDGLVSFNQSQRTRLAAIVPRQQDIAGLFVQMQALAQRHGMVLPSVNISATSAATAADGTPSSSGLGELSLSFSVSGQDYDRFKRFVSDLQQNLRLFDITVINFSSAQEGPYSLTLKTYYRP